jgi:hypothetical protein
MMTPRLRPPARGLPARYLVKTLLFFIDVIKFPDLIRAVKILIVPFLSSGQLLGLHRSDPREHAHDHVSRVRPGHPSFAALHRKFRRAYGLA